MNRFHLKACAKCQGDLVLDEGDWLCLQCGTYYYIGLYRKQGLFRQPQQPAEPPRQDKGLILDQLTAGPLLGQASPPTLPQRAGFSLTTRLNISPECQISVRDSITLKS